MAKGNLSPKIIVNHEDWHLDWKSSQDITFHENSWKEKLIFYAVAAHHFIVAQLPPQMLWNCIQHRFVFQLSYPIHFPAAD